MMEKARALRIIKTVITVVFILVLVVGLAVVNPQLKTNKILSNLLNLNHQNIDNSHIATQAKGMNLNYYQADYTKENIKAAEDKLAAEIAGQGVVLLKNDDSMLPMRSGTQLSLFSANSVKSNVVSIKLPNGIKSVNAKSVLEQEGFKVNKKLWNYYSKGAGKKYGLASGSVNFGEKENFRINEASINTLSKEDGLLESVKNTTPVYVLSRVAGEGRDMPRSMYNHATTDQDKKRSYLEPNSDELSVIAYLNQHFKNVVLLVNSNAALDLGWTEQYHNIKAIVYSENINLQLAQVLSGKINPSGRTVDTFARQSLNSPAAQNFGDYQYYDRRGHPTKYNYVTYAEGIYVGYRYYETRYEDQILQQGNPGDFNYAHEVIYPFGYGLSYTSFAWSNFTVQIQGNHFLGSLDVKNVGKRSGRDTVELFAQSPYTEYDKDNNIEKSSVDLVGFAKTKQLKPGQQVRVTISFNKDLLKSYDSSKAKTFILDAGLYRFTAGRNAHDAINNILSDKGKRQADGLTVEGNSAMVSRYSPANTDADTTAYSKDSRTGKPVTNLFDAARSDITYMSRSNWSGTFPKHDGEPSTQTSTWGGEINGSKNGHPQAYTWKKEADDQLIQRLDSHDSGRISSSDLIKKQPVFGKDAKRSLIQMRGLSYANKEWDYLLDQLTEDDYQKIIFDSGYGLDYIKSVGKPYSADADTAYGLIYGGTGRLFPITMMVAQTFNHDLAKDFGVMIGNEALLGGTNGWYAPSMNIHRTPFSGRNGEYFSEDPFLSGDLAAAEVMGAATKGVYSYIKHFALNDQENHRGDRPGNFGIATWANEQSIRQIYLEPFEACLKLPDIPMKYVKYEGQGRYVNTTAKVPTAMGVMTSFNRIGATWTGGSYPLITQLLRQEWGFNGLVITDNANTGVFMNPKQMIEAGADLKLLSVDKDPTNAELDLRDPRTYSYARQAAHHMLYVVANSKAMNGAMPGSQFNYFNYMVIIRYAINICVGALILLLVWFSVRRHTKKVIDRKAARKQARKEARLAKANLRNS